MAGVLKPFRSGAQWALRPLVAGSWLRFGSSQAAVVNLRLGRPVCFICRAAGHLPAECSIVSSTPPGFDSGDVWLVKAGPFVFRQTGSAVSPPPPSIGEEGRQVLESAPALARADSEGEPLMGSFSPLKGKEGVRSSDPSLRGSHRDPHLGGDSAPAAPRRRLLVVPGRGRVAPR